MKTAALYVHVPWCRRRCPYCDFYLHVAKPHQDFVSSIKKEFLKRQEEWANHKAQTLYFGGGTPSLLAPEDLNDLIDFFSTKANLVNNAEISLEINPEDINNDFIEKLRDTRINRLSMGVQSFYDPSLRFLGRMHTEKIAKDALESLVKYYDNISVDLIIGLPNEDILLLEKQIEYLNSINIKHISAYLLTIEEGTNFYRRIQKKQMPAPSDDKQAEAYEKNQSFLAHYGYRQYEISSFARPLYESQHNQVYWRHEPYLGLGPGAHSMRVLDMGIERSHNQSDLKAWLKDPDQSKFAREYLAPKEALNEALSFGLRNLLTGINPEKIAKKYNIILDDNFYNIIKKYINYGHIEQENNTYKIKAQASLFADAIMRDILSL